ncbi:MAG TPA: DUF6514 family protein [Ruminiclostridium sp.]
MMKRCLENKVILELNNDGRLDCKENVVLEYYLLENELESPEGFIGKKAYGIEIVKNINEKFVEGESIKNCSIYKESTLEFLNKLARNTVTPIGLLYSFDDCSGI